MVLLAGAKATHGGAFALWPLVDCLCHCEPNEPKAGLVDAWGALLAGQVLVENAELDRVSESNQPKVSRVQRWLVHILWKSLLPAVEHALRPAIAWHAGRPRFDPDAWYLPAELLFGFLEIPEGSFLMGSDPKKDKDVF